MDSEQPGVLIDRTAEYIQVLFDAGFSRESVLDRSIEYALGVINELKHGHSFATSDDWTQGQLDAAKAVCQAIQRFG